MPILGSRTGARYDVVVYGSGFAGVAAAVGVAGLLPGARVLLVAPESGFVVGGLFTAGGQNFWDLRYWRNGPPQGGSCARWVHSLGQFYSTEEMADHLAMELETAGVQTLIGYDIEDYTYSGPLLRLTGLSLRRLMPAPDGGSAWAAEIQEISATVFVDASDDGRLARLAGAVLSVGRADWPAPYLPADEVGLAGGPLMQAATLMFQVRGVTPGLYADMAFTESRDARGRRTWGAWGGRRTYATSPTIVAFNDASGPRGYALKPLNAAQNGPGASEWWVNGLLLFDVDARACDRDAGGWRYPPDVRGDARSTDAAWALGRLVVVSPDFLQALRCFPGFEAVEIVCDEKGLPAVGETLYLRESVHAVLAPRPGENGLENSNYAVTAQAAVRAGAAHTRNNLDDAYYATRIGLGFYFSDINAYRFSDLKPGKGYVWPVTGQSRPDWPGNPTNPVYLPYNCLLAPAIGNLLVGGYAAGAAAMAFTELRVGPNLCVLGDAAGAAAALAVQYGRDPADFGPEEVLALQAGLRRLAARLDK